MSQENTGFSVMVYMRAPVPGEYPAGLAQSVHLALSDDGVHFRPLNQNYGVVFAQGTIRTDDTIHPKGVKEPRVFSIGEGRYGIAAVSVNEDGSPDEEMAGKMFFWTTADFISFREETPLDAKETESEAGQEISGAMLKLKSGEGCEFGRAVSQNADFGSISQTDVSGSMQELGRIHDVGSTVSQAVISRFTLEDGETVTGSVVSVDEQLYDRMTQYWSQVYNCGVSVPETVETDSPEALADVKAVLTYSDGSRTLRRVAWNISTVNFGRSGIYEISGTVQEIRYPFPLAEGYGDPVILFWEGRKYYIATNDNKNDIGLYVREAPTMDGLFAEGITEHLILGEDEKRNLHQTFWAPEFHRIGGELYILFAVSGRVWGPQCHMMRLKKDGSITDPDSWTDPVRVRRKDGSWLSEDGITLDMTYLKAGGRSYLVWSYRRHIGSPMDTGSMLYIAETDERTPWQLTSEPVLLTRPLYGWENVDGTINNEGPYAFQADGKVYLTYSGGSANAYTYVLGLLTANADDDLLDMANWTKSGHPVLSYYSVEGVYGPGHNSFYTDEDGNLMIAYHGETSIDGHLRCVGIRRVHFDAEGRPRFDLSADRDLDPALRKVRMRVIV